MSEAELRLQGAFKEALGIGDDTDFANLEYQGIEEWDSVAHMILVAAIEETFDIMLDTEHVIDMSSYKKAVEIVESYGVTFG